MEPISIGGCLLGAGYPAFIIAELSANHGRSLDRALDLVRAASEAGANAVKLQTYTPGTITIDASSEYFRIQGTIWEGRTLYQLYEEAYTPWEWHASLKAAAECLGLQFLSSPFDPTAVDFLEELGVSAYKVASFEAVDIPLLRKVGQTGKPVILSTGMASFAEIEEAVLNLRSSGAGGLCLLKCTSAYPAPPEEMNLKTIPHLAAYFGVPVGLSDHTLGGVVPVTAVSQGAAVIEKHLTLSRADGGPDSAFSMEPHEFRRMVEDVRVAERALGEISYTQTSKEMENRAFRRSLFVVEDVRAGRRFTEQNVRSIRPGHGLHTRYLDVVLGQRATMDVNRGTPMRWEFMDLGGLDNGISEKEQTE
jgi:pseudaminic acid synthase